MPFLTGKCFFRWTASRTGAPLLGASTLRAGALPAASSTAASTIKLFRMPARRPMARAFLFIVRIEGAALLVGIGTARREGAAGRQIGQGRHHARDFLQPAVRRHRYLAADDREVRDRGEEAMRVGVERCLEQLLDICLLDLLAGDRD